jgi:NADH:ubiquinone oxidoreductase subunit C
MDITKELQTAEDLLKPWTVETKRPDDRRLDVKLEAKDLLDAVKALVDARWGYLAAITGLDHPAPKPPVVEGEPAPAPTVEGNLEALYHFCFGAAIATLRVSVPYSNPQVPSVCGLIPSATLYERELMELFGFVCENTPNPSRLVLPDDWPDGVYPLRKSFTGFAVNQP